MENGEYCRLKEGCLQKGGELWHPPELRVTDNVSKRSRTKMTISEGGTKVWNWRICEGRSCSPSPIDYIGEMIFW